ncbi:hypothetical protein B4U79_18258 [Dinothrombium tinctorium]|uniref:Uncharacterized protein n=1 Tax=Dinothrombium tinctorium TaxID=1965070 RepID=A0A443QTY2_9ACAR|nr:hypothetical protein B4U79_18258 [Dinothrombium tinctorium]
MNPNEVFVFKDHYFYTFNILKSNYEIFTTWRNISERWAHLPSNLDAAFTTGVHYVFIKNTNYYIYALNSNASEYNGSITEWQNFPTQVEAIESIADPDAKNATATRFIRVYASFSLHFCRIDHLAETIRYDVLCEAIGEFSKASETMSTIGKKLGLPIAAAARLQNEFKIFFGADSYCIVPINGYFRNLAVLAKRCKTKIKD